LQGVSARQYETGQGAPEEVHHQSSIVGELLKFRCRPIAIVEHEIGFPTQISGAQEYREVRWHAKFNGARRLQSPTARCSGSTRR
jgi:hypothetical protein